MTNLKTMLEDAAEKYGEKTAIVSGVFRISYINLQEASNRIANGLLQVGVSRGDRVVMLLNNSPQFVEIFFGIVKLGAIAVPLDTKYKTKELKCLLKHCQPKVLFTESPYLEGIDSLITELDSIEYVFDLSAGANNKQFRNYKELTERSSTQCRAVDIKSEDIACILYTSGPALTPKGTALSHINLVKAVTISAAGFHQTDRDIVILFALPMHYVVGLVIVLLTSIYRGSTVVILPGLSITRLMQVIEKERITILIGVPFIHALIVKKAKEESMVYNLNSLRICGSIGATLSQKIVQQFEKYLGFQLINFYGLTESTAHVSCQPLDGSGKLGSVGRILPGWEAKIVDNRNRELPVKRSGEVIVRGPIMSRYYRNPNDTAEMIKHGWLYTGDIGMMDDDGYLFLTGLKKDMIIAKGQNIYPSDIETVLLCHPKVSEAAVTSIPDEMRGEIVGSVVILKFGEVATEQEIKKFCLKHLADFKVPKQVIFLDSLIKTDDGMINKQVIRKHLLKTYTIGREKDIVGS
jgi:long-chain acyl-CoA synthetase